jgi:hypothetical protein
MDIGESSISIDTSREDTETSGLLQSAKSSSCNPDYVSIEDYSDYFGQGMSMYSSNASSQCKCDDDDSFHDSVTDGSISITVLDYASSLEALVQPSIAQPSSIVQSVPSIQSMQSFRSLHYSERSISPPPTPKRQNYNQRRKQLVHSARSKAGAQKNTACGRPMAKITTRCLLVGLLAIALISSSWWQRHAKKSDSQNPNPYYFWSLLYSDDTAHRLDDTDLHDAILPQSIFSKIRSRMNFIDINESFGETSSTTIGSGTSVSKSYRPPTITTIKSSSKSHSSKLVIAGKMSVQDGFCNIAELSLATGEWSLKERIQLSLYNSYSGGEVYSLLVNHTFSKASLPFFDNGNGGVVNYRGGLLSEEKPKAKDQGGSSR